MAPASRGPAAPGWSRNVLRCIDPGVFVLGWVLVGGGDVRREVAAVPPGTGSQPRVPGRAAAFCRGAARVCLPGAVVVVAGLDRFETAPAGGGRPRRRAPRAVCGAWWGLPGTCWSRSTGYCPVPAPCWWFWPLDSARCGCRGGGRRTVCCQPRSRCAGRLCVAVLPSAWVLAEAVRSWHRLGGPWALLGASQWSQPVTLVSASLGGVWLKFSARCDQYRGRRGDPGPGVARWVITLAVALVCAGLGPAWFVLSPAPPDGLPESEMSPGCTTATPVPRRTVRRCRTQHEPGRPQSCTPQRYRQCDDPTGDTPVQDHPCHRGIGRDEQETLSATLAEGGRHQRGGLIPLRRAE